MAEVDTVTRRRERQDELHEIFRQIASGEKPHGDFLTLFAKAYVRADHLNKPLLFDVAEKLVAKYELKEK